MKLKRLRLPLMLTALTAVLTMGAFAADEHSHCVCGGENTVGDHTEHQAVEWTAWEENDKLPTEDGYYYLTTDVNLTDRWLVEKNISLCLNGHNITETADLNATITFNGIFYVNGGMLTLTDCAGEAGSIQNADGITNKAISINNSGTMVMYNGSFRNPTENEWLASALSMSHGTFIMNGGSITGCTSATGNWSLYIYDDSQFVMNGGQILDGVNVSYSIIHLYDSSFTMNGGTIRGNSDSQNRGGIWFDSDSSFTMNDGTISNVDTGVRIDRGTDVVENGVVVTKNGEFTMNGGTISSCTNDGVSAGGIFTMNGGTIKSCGTGIVGYGNATIHDGLIESCSNTGIEASFSGTLTMGGGTIQNCGNSGIELHGTMQLSGSPVISGNYDKKGRERSIYFYSTASKIVVTGALGSDASFGVYRSDSKDSVIAGSDDYALTASDLQKFHSENLQLVLNPKTTNGKLEGWLEYRKANAFSDVGKDYWCYNAVNWAVENGITNGTTETTFGPTNGCTRAQMVTFLWRAAGEPHAKNSVNPFTDVSPNRYYYDAVLWAVEQGITTGATETTFEPDRLCTRGHIVTFLWRAAGKPSHSAAAAPFTDVAKNAYCYDAVLWASENGITQGMTATTFAPNRTCTRAQGVTFLYRAQSYLQ